MQLVESVESGFHLLQEGNSDSELRQRRNVADFQVQDVLAIGVNGADGCLLAFALGLLEFLFRLLLLFDDALDLHVAELDTELVDGGLWGNGHCVVDFQELIDGVPVDLFESDVQ